jgi:hypothetical protein
MSETRAIMVVAIAVIVGFGIFSGGSNSTGSKPGSNGQPAQAAAASDAKETPEPARPAAGQEVSEEYFKWISSKVHFDCQQAIKKLVRYDMRAPGIFYGTNTMNDMTFILKFERWSRRVHSDNTIGITGDHAEAQNGFGNWMRANYSCTVNIDTKTVTDASLGNGRLN